MIFAALFGFSCRDISLQAALLSHVMSGSTTSLTPKQKELVSVVWCLGGSRCCLRGVSVVSVVSRWCLGGVSVVPVVVFRWCLGGGGGVSDALMVFWWCLELFWRHAGVLQVVNVYIIIYIIIYMRLL